MEQRLRRGLPAPGFSLVATASGRRVSLASCAGRPLVLVFHLRDTAPAARAVNRAIREAYPRPDAVTVASVLDLSIVPPLYWGAVGLELSRAYRSAVEELPDSMPPDADPADYVIILPDWSGLTARRFGARDTNRAAAVVVIDAESRVAGAHTGAKGAAGEDLSAAVIETLRGLVPN